jgi:hypothetical protein
MALLPEPVAPHPSLGFEDLQGARALPSNFDFISDSLDLRSESARKIQSMIAASVPARLVSLRRFANKKLCLEGLHSTSRRSGFGTSREKSWYARRKISERPSSFCSMGPKSQASSSAVASTPTVRASISGGQTLASTALARISRALQRIRSVSTHDA